MLHACVQKLDVTDTVQTNLETKRSLGVTCLLAAGSRTARNNQAASRGDRRPGRRGAACGRAWRQRSERGAAQRPPTGELRRAIQLGLKSDEIRGRLII